MLCAKPVLGQLYQFGLGMDKSVRLNICVSLKKKDEGHSLQERQGF